VISRVLMLLMLMSLSSTGYSADVAGIPALTLVDNGDGSQSYTVTIQVLAMMTMLSFLPAIVMMMTSFTRIIVVFSILRQAMGLQQTPSNQILVGLALFLSLFIMTPVFEEVYEKAAQPYMDEKIEAGVALDLALKPFRKFMLAQTRETDMAIFLNLSKRGNNNVGYASIDDVPMTVVIPAFVTSELKTAFQIGFLLFIPFLIIDLVVASVLMAMGMMMLSPLIVSLPFKIMLFVFVDGWAMIIGTVAASFGTT